MSQKEAQPENKITIAQLIEDRRDIVLKVQSGGNAAILNAFDDVSNQLAALSDQFVAVTKERDILKTTIQALTVQIDKKKAKEIKK